MFLGSIAPQQRHLANSKSDLSLLLTLVAKGDCALESQRQSKSRIYIIRHANDKHTGANEATAAHLESTQAIKPKKTTC